MLAITSSLVIAAQVAASPQPQIGGSLQVAGRPEMVCPLKATKVRGNVFGPAARVSLEQTFVNTAKDKIEAIYTFPLPENAAVDRMVFRIGDRVIEGEIKRREEAQKMYQEAKANNQAAALLDQSRPNLFVQSVAHIPAGATVKVEVSYVNMLRFEDGQFEIMFPMVVAPRFGAAKDAPNPVYSKTKFDTKLDVEFNINAGTKIHSLTSETHKLDLRNSGETAAFRLKDPAEIPNRDLVVRYEVGDAGIRPAMVTNWDAKKGGHFCFMLLPPKAPTEAQISPRDVMFVMDQSGSQSGFAIEKSKELTIKMLDRLRPGDTFNVFGFNTTVKRLFPISMPPTAENIALAKQFVQGMKADGGTYVREGVVAALQDAPMGNRLKIVLFNTDGLVGNESDVLQAIVAHRDRARMFNFGIGHSVNRYLLDAMTVEGRGDVEYVTAGTNLDQSVARFVRRTETPTLVDVSAEFSGDVEVHSASPAHLPDLFGQRPIFIFGKYKKSGPVQVRVAGRVAGKAWSQNFAFDLNAAAGEPTVSTLWARSAVDDLSRQQYVAETMQRQVNNDAVKKAITQLGLDYRIMTEYTSFIAVDKVRQADGRVVTVPVPVNQPDGMEAFDTGYGAALSKSRMPGSPMAGRPAGSGSGGGMVTAELANVTPKPVPSKVDAKLAKATGVTKIMLELNDVSAATQKKLRQLGVKVVRVDKKSKTIAAEVDASLFMKLDAMPEVLAIRAR